MVCPGLLFEQLFAFCRSSLQRLTQGAERLLLLLSSLLLQPLFLLLQLRM